MGKQFTSKGRSRFAGSPVEWYQKDTGIPPNGSNGIRVKRICTLSAYCNKSMILPMLVSDQRTAHINCLLPVIWPRYKYSNWKLATSDRGMISGPTCLPNSSNANAGNPTEVLNAGSKERPRWLARTRRVWSFDNAYAESIPPRYRITVSKNGTWPPYHSH